MRVRPPYILIYFILEVLAFYVVSRLIGVGWALIALFVLFFLGILIGALEMRSIAMRALRGTDSAGALMGDYTLSIIGAFGIALPGFLSSIGGLLCVFPPTRFLIRRMIARTIYNRMEQFSQQFMTSAMRYTSRNNSNTFGSFGSFGSEPPQSNPDQGPNNQGPYA
ncbi:MAG: FxsA family protein [Corynebacterium sp.]|nr:FxsA family protein [Corynebacterium sp.]